MTEHNLRIAIVHFLPLEYYPPAVNFLNFISTRERNVHVFSTHNVLGRQVYKNHHARIHRYPLARPDQNRLLRALCYFYFNLGVFCRLLWHRPHKILYYETYSAFPVYAYMKLFRAELFIHFHEYFDLEWYKKAMKLTKIFHQLEVPFLFERAKWISQTNEHRINFFHGDYPFLDKARLKVIPNYPPKRWGILQGAPRSGHAPVKMVYIGALSFEKTYIREVVKWAAGLGKEATLDIYSYNFKSDVKEFLKNNLPTNARFVEEGIEYEEIPNLLKKYDVGLIMYKGQSLNQRFAATNKLFEYLVCGLDVWFTEEMEAIYPAVTAGTYPKVVKFNFNFLEQIDIDKVIDKSGLIYKPLDFFAEDAFKELVDELMMEER